MSSDERQWDSKAVTAVNVRHLEIIVVLRLHMLVDSGGRSSSPPLCHAVALLRTKLCLILAADH